MRILVLEDDEDRIQWFRKMFFGHYCHIVQNAGDAIKAVLSQKYDLIYLDHDLDGRVYVPSEESNTGYQVAKVQAKSINRNTRTIIHTHNGPGAEKMLAVLPNAERIPFCRLGVLIEGLDFLKGSV